MRLASPYLDFLLRNLESRFLGHHRPLLAGFKLTHRCNLRCAGCPYWRRPGDDIPFQKALETFDQLRQLGVRLVIFEGGEPFIWRDGERRLDDLILEAKKRFFFVGVTTNGTFSLESKADVLWVSIDGLEENHDFNRGPTFQQIMENLERSSHPRKLAQVTINKRNWEEIPDLIRFLTGKVMGITFQFYYPYPETADLFVPPRERAMVLDEMIRLKREGYPVLDSIGTLEALKENRWRCQDWLIADAEPTGEIHVGCYLKGRGEADCSKCGFAAHTELSLAYNWRADAILAGLQVFGLRPLVRLAA